MAPLWRMLAVVLVVLATGCPPPHPPSGLCVEDCTGRPVDFAEPTVNLLVRSFLVRRTTERPTYAFYAYLYFSDKGIRTAPVRTAAAKAVLSLFDDARDVGGLGLHDSQLAVLHVPVVSRGIAERIRELGTPDNLVAGYDYARARLLKGQVEARTGTSLPSVALLGYPRPLFGQQTPIDVSKMYVISLDDLTELDVQDRILRFQGALNSHPAMISATMYQAQSYFARVGKALQGYSAPK